MLPYLKEKNLIVKILDFKYDLETNELRKKVEEIHKKYKIQSG